jgi:hypothetical protein
MRRVDGKIATLPPPDRTRTLSHCGGSVQGKSRAVWGMITTSPVEYNYYRTVHFRTPCHTNPGHTSSSALHLQVVR